MYLFKNRLTFSASCIFCFSLKVATWGDDSIVLNLLCYLSAYPYSGHLFVYTAYSSHVWALLRVNLMLIPPQCNIIKNQLLIFILKKYVLVSIIIKINLRFHNVLNEYINRLYKLLFYKHFLVKFLSELCPSKMKYKRVVGVELADRSISVRRRLMNVLLLLLHQKSLSYLLFSRSHSHGIVSLNNVKILLYSK